jgi:hypothetical protein
MRRRPGESASASRVISRAVGARESVRQGIEAGDSAWGGLHDTAKSAGTPYLVNSCQHVLR